MAGKSGRWYTGGVTELNLLQEAINTIPAAGGVGVPVTVQQAGFVKTLRGYLDAQIAQASGTGAPSKSQYGPLGSSLKRLQVLVAGRKPFFSVSGLGLAIYTEVANPYGSVVAVPPFLGVTELNWTEAKHLTEYTAPTTGATTYNLRQPFEVNFGLPVWMTNLFAKDKAAVPVDYLEEVGLWYLQERKTALTLEAEFFAATVASGPLAPYNGGTAVVAAWNAATSRLRWERQLYSVPPNADDWPDQRFVHVVLETPAIPIVGKSWTYQIPQVGALLRAIVIMEDATPAFVEWDDLLNLQWTYGTSDKPIDRPGWALTHDYLYDYHNYPPKGVVVLDFYKAGMQATKLARNTDSIANLQLIGTHSATTTGAVRVITESLVPYSMVI
jgi:hypothetical protein